VATIDNVEGQILNEKCSLTDFISFPQIYFKNLYAFKEEKGKRKNKMNK